MENLNLNFKEFVEAAEEHFMSDVKETMLKIPPKHKALLKGYKFHNEKGNTLSGDKGHIGEIDEKKKKIKVAAPWNYGREFTILHELAHACYKYIMTTKLKEEWAKVLKTTKKEMKNKNKENKSSLDQNDEELFCMAYANFYSKHKSKTYDHDSWHNFIQRLPK